MNPINYCSVTLPIIAFVVLIYIIRTTEVYYREENEAKEQLKKEARQREQMGYDRLSKVVSDSQAIASELYTTMKNAESWLAKLNTNSKMGLLPHSGMLLNMPRTVWQHSIPISIN